MSVSHTNPAIKEACEMVRHLSGDERNRALAEAREKARMDLDSLLGDARQDGIYSVAKNLLRKKMSCDDVADATGLSIEDVKRLAADLS